SLRRGVVELEEQVAEDDQEDQAAEPHAEQGLRRGDRPAAQAPPRRRLGPGRRARPRTLGGAGGPTDAGGASCPGSPTVAVAAGAGAETAPCGEAGPTGRDAVIRPA